jgi:Na+-transporting NADH:ubiquinone oxidoreductase subunit NqrC
MHSSEYINPNLTEPGVKYYMTQTLKVCNISKNKHFNIIFNISTLILIVSIIILTLYYRYKGMPTLQERQQKSEEKKKYILGKIQTMQKIKQNNSLDLITNLPIK